MFHVVYKTKKGNQDLIAKRETEEEAKVVCDKYIKMGYDAFIKKTGVKGWLNLRPNKK